MEFDVYEGEAMYYHEAKQLVEDMKEQGMLSYQ